MSRWRLARALGKLAMKNVSFILLLVCIASLCVYGQQQTPPPDRGTWRLYRPEELPAGKRLSVQQAVALDDGSYGSERLYLVGRFVVTGWAAERVVLRSEQQLPKARIVAIYPFSLLTPPASSELTRDDKRPFQIMDVRRGTDGQVTIYVREIIAGSRPTPLATPFLYDKLSLPKKP